MDLKKTVVDVLASMATGNGEAKSEDLLFSEVLKIHKELVDSQVEIRKAINELIEDGTIIHDSTMKSWIRLNK